MLKTLHKISSALLVALGLVHTALTPVFYGRFSHNALWFAGSGLAMVFVGLLKLTLGRDVGICTYNTPGTLLPYVLILKTYIFVLSRIMKLPRLPRTLGRSRPRLRLSSIESRI